MAVVNYSQNFGNMGTVDITYSDEPALFQEMQSSNILNDGSQTGWSVLDLGGTTTNWQVLHPRNLAASRIIWRNLQSIPALSTFDSYEKFVPITTNEICIRWTTSSCDETATANWTTTSGDWRTPGERLAQIIRQRCSPAIRTTKKGLFATDEERELRARKTLRRILGEIQYRYYLKKGFIAVRNPISGYTYKIGPRQSPRAYKDGKCVSQFCIHLIGFTPTDFVITLYLLALNDDSKIWKIGNSSVPYCSQNTNVQMPEESLVDIFKRLKAISLPLQGGNLTSVA